MDTLKNVTISTNSDNNQCSKTKVHFEEPDGMTDIDLHEIISCPSTSDTKCRKKFHMPKLLLPIGTGFIIITGIFLSFLLLNDSTTPPMLPNYNPKKTNFQKPMILIELSINNKKGDMDKFDSPKASDLSEFSNNQYKIKRDISSLYMDKLQTVDNESKKDEQNRKLKILNSAPNENAIQNELTKWSRSGNYENGKVFKSQVSSSSTTYFHDTVNQITTEADNSLNQNELNSERFVNSYSGKESSAVINDANEFIPTIISTSDDAIKYNDLATKRSMEKYTDYEDTLPTDIYQSKLSAQSTFYNTENQLRAKGSWDRRLEEDRDYQHMPKSTPIYPQDISEKDGDYEREITSTPIYSQDGNHEHKITSTPIYSQDTSEKDGDYEREITSAHISSQDYSEKEGNYESEITWPPIYSEDNSEKDGDYEREITSIHIYSQDSSEKDRDYESEITSTPIYPQDNSEKDGHYEREITSIHIYSQDSSEKDRDYESEITSTSIYPHDNSQKDGDYEREITLTPIYSQDNSEEGGDYEREITSTPIYSQAKSEKEGDYEHDITSTSVYSQDNSKKDGDYEREITSTPIYPQDNSEKDGYYEREITSTSIYSQDNSEKSGDYEREITSTPVYSQDNPEKSGDYEPEITSTPIYSQDTSEKEGDYEDDIISTPVYSQDNSEKDGDYEHEITSTPIYSQDNSKKDGDYEREITSTPIYSQDNSEKDGDYERDITSTSIYSQENSEKSGGYEREIISTPVYSQDNSEKDGDYEREITSTPIYSQDNSDKDGDYEREITSTSIYSQENSEKSGDYEREITSTPIYSQDNSEKSGDYEHEITSTAIYFQDTSEKDGDYELEITSTPIYSQENSEKSGDYEHAITSTAIYSQSTSEKDGDYEGEITSTRIYSRDNSGKDGDYKREITTTSVYSQESIDDLTSTSHNWGIKNELDQKESNHGPNTLLKNYKSDTFEHTSTSPSHNSEPTYEVPSPFGSLESANQLVYSTKNEFKSTQSTSIPYETTNKISFVIGTDESNWSEESISSETKLASTITNSDFYESTSQTISTKEDKKVENNLDQEYKFSTTFKIQSNNSEIELGSELSNNITSTKEERYVMSRTNNSDSNKFNPAVDNNQIRNQLKSNDDTFIEYEDLQDISVMENIYDSYEDTTKTTATTDSTEDESSKISQENDLTEENIIENVEPASSSPLPFISDVHMFTTNVNPITEIHAKWYKNKNFDENNNFDQYKNNEFESTAVNSNFLESSSNDVDSYEQTKSPTNNYFTEKEYTENVLVNPGNAGVGITDPNHNPESDIPVSSASEFRNIQKYNQPEFSTVINSSDHGDFTNNIVSATDSYETVSSFISDKEPIEKPNTFNLARFNRKASALKNRTQLLHKYSTGLAYNFRHETEMNFITTTLPTTTKNNFTGNTVPMHVRWSGQDANNFENMKIAAKEFATVNEHLQTSQQSTLNQNFGKAVCPTFISPMGFPVLQQPSAFPYLYNTNQASPYTNVMPFPIPRTQANAYIAQQYPYAGADSLSSYNKGMMQQSGYVMYNVNGQNVITPSAGGQYYICNPLPNVLGNSNTDTIPQIEIRNSENDNLQSFASEILENRTRASRHCPFGERSCEDDSKCIKTHHFCDGEVQCKDASDEAFCPCKLKIGKSRQCDGYFDCPNGEDELNCFGCEANMFSCDDWSQNDRTATCIPAEQRCDGVPQCSTEKDEHDCSILTATLSEKQHFIVSTTVGFLYRNFKGRWYPVCRNPELWANQACQSAAGPSTMAPLTHLVPVDANYNGPYISASRKEDSKIVNSCEPGAAIFVECPPLVCGMRKKIRNPYRREEVDTSAEQILSQFERANQPPESQNITDSVLGESRVVGGKPSQPEAWPWIVSVYRNGVFHCGGALINEMWLVTACHCVEKYWHYYYEVQAGVLRRYSYAPMVQNRMISHIISHQLYDRTKLKNDLALMRMSQPLHFGRYVRPICLPSEITAGKNFKWGPEPGTVCTAVGWGATVEHGSDPDHLREVEVPILKHCKHREDQEGNEICAGLMEGGKDACQGDSGGPFMCRNPNSPNQWYLAGIVSHGEGCARPNEPGVYTRVSLFLEWIYENIRAEILPQTRPLHRCPGYICRKTNRCIANKRRCNKVVDCLLGDDEMHCDKNNFNEIFKHAMRHMLFRSDDMDNNSTTSSPTTELNGEVTLLLSSQINVSNTDNFENISDAIETSTLVQQITTFPDRSSKQGYNKNFVCKKIVQTIDISKQCDRTADCEDATDEEDCTCASYLRKSHPQLICDGVTDCLDMSDETNCHVCQQSEYHCRHSNICIIMEKRCNNVPDCPLEEDERDCFALTNGQTIILDGDLRPYLNDSGIITFNHNGKWRPVCSNWTSREASSAADTCSYLGFSDYRSFLRVPVYDNPLQITQNSSAPVANIISVGNRCIALFVKCLDVIDVTHLTELANISKIINSMQENPWNAEIYVNGKFKCTATILNVDWIITSTSCFEKDFMLVNKYVAVLLGRSNTYLHVMGPHEQVIRIIESIQVSDSDIILLRLSNRIHASRYIRPIHLSVRDFSVSERETCIALGRNFENVTESIILQTVTNCTFGFRCFKRTRPINEFCQNKNFTAWSGSIVCQSKHGWYPAAVFHEPRGSCGFISTTAYTSVQYWRANILKLMRQAAFAVDAPPCEGFRCSLGHCLKEDKICDGIPDCRDAGDEDANYCAEKRNQCSASSSCVCLKSELKCQNGKCVPKTAFCDTNNDCGDWSDEPESCNCRAYLALTNPDIVCDGVRHCQDRTDEDPHLCTCKRYHFVCGESNYCIPQDMVCDGVPDCPNGHDEAHCIALTSTPGSSTTEVQIRTAGIWHPGCFPKHLTTLQLERICEKIGYAGGSAVRINTGSNWKTGWRPVTDPFKGILIHHTAKRNVIIAIRSGSKPLVTLKSDFNCYRLFLQCS